MSEGSQMSPTAYNAPPSTEARLSSCHERRRIFKLEARSIKKILAMMRMVTDAMEKDLANDEYGTILSADLSQSPSTPQCTGGSGFPYQPHQQQQPQQQQHPHLSHQTTQQPFHKHPTDPSQRTSSVASRLGSGNLEFTLSASGSNNPEFLGMRDLPVIVSESVQHYRQQQLNQQQQEESRRPLQQHQQQQEESRRPLQQQQQQQEESRRPLQQQQQPRRSQQQQQYTTRMKQHRQLDIERLQEEDENKVEMEEEEEEEDPEEDETWRREQKPLLPQQQNRYQQNNSKEETRQHYHKRLQHQQQYHQQNQQQQQLQKQKQQQQQFHSHQQQQLHNHQQQQHEQQHQKSQHCQSKRRSTGPPHRTNHPQSNTHSNSPQNTQSLEDSLDNEADRSSSHQPTKRNATHGGPDRTKIFLEAGGKPERPPVPSGRIWKPPGVLVSQRNTNEGLVKPSACNTRRMSTVSSRQPSGYRKPGPGTQQARRWNASDRESRKYLRIQSIIHRLRFYHSLGDDNVILTPDELNNARHTINRLNRSFSQTIVSRRDEGKLDLPDNHHQHLDNHHHDEDETLQFPDTAECWQLPRSLSDTNLKSDRTLLTDNKGFTDLASSHDQMVEAFSVRDQLARDDGSSIIANRLFSNEDTIVSSKETATKVTEEDRKQEQTQEEREEIEDKGEIHITNEGTKHRVSNSPQKAVPRMERGVNRRLGSSPEYKDSHSVAARAASIKSKYMAHLQNESPSLQNFNSKRNLNSLDDVLNTVDDDGSTGVREYPHIAVPNVEPALVQKCSMDTDMVSQHALKSSEIFPDCTNTVVDTKSKCYNAVSENDLKTTDPIAENTSFLLSDSMNNYGVSQGGVKNTETPPENTSIIQTDSINNVPVSQNDFKNTETFLVNTTDSPGVSDLSSQKVSTLGQKASLPVRRPWALKRLVAMECSSTEASDIQEHTNSSIKEKSVVQSPNLSEAQTLQISDIHGHTHSSKKEKSVVQSPNLSEAQIVEISDIQQHTNASEIIGDSTEERSVPRYKTNYTGQVDYPRKEISDSPNWSEFETSDRGRPVPHKTNTSPRKEISDSPNWSEFETSDREKPVPRKHKTSLSEVEHSPEEISVLERTKMWEAEISVREQSSLRSKTTIWEEVKRESKASVSPLRSSESVGESKKSTSPLRTDVFDAENKKLKSPVRVNLVEAENRKMKSPLRTIAFEVKHKKSVSPPKAAHSVVKNKISISPLKATMAAIENITQERSVLQKAKLWELQNSSIEASAHPFKAQLLEDDNSNSEDLVDHRNINFLDDENDGKRNLFINYNEDFCERECSANEQSLPCQTITLVKNDGRRNSFINYSEDSCERECSTNEQTLPCLTVTQFEMEHSGIPSDYTNPNKATSLTFEQDKERNSTESNENVSKTVTESIPIVQAKKNDLQELLFSINTTESKTEESVHDLQESIHITYSKTENDIHDRPESINIDEWKKENTAHQVPKPIDIYESKSENAQEVQHSVQNLVVESIENQPKSPNFKTEIQVTLPKYTSKCNTPSVVFDITEEPIIPSKCNTRSLTISPHVNPNCQIPSLSSDTTEMQTATPSNVNQEYKQSSTKSNVDDQTVSATCHAESEITLATSNAGSNTVSLSKPKAGNQTLLPHSHAERIASLQNVEETAEIETTLPKSNAGIETLLSNCNADGIASLQNVETTDHENTLPKSNTGSQISLPKCYEDVRASMQNVHTTENENMMTKSNTGSQISLPKCYEDVRASVQNVHTTENENMMPKSNTGSQISLPPCYTDVRASVQNVDTAENELTLLKSNTGSQISLPNCYAEDQTKCFDCKTIKNQQMSPKFNTGQTQMPVDDSKNETSSSNDNAETQITLSHGTSEMEMSFPDSITEHK